ncbi:MAG TPA: sodium:solute symporter family protein [Acetobacteraceae bacterium]|jgi:SSS family solute:Na+ symporter|nr:sodium:solute symporter family protein [Acetobacteraceae bacterium]
MNSALVLIGFAALVALLLGIAARRGKKMGMEQWAVGGRGFGWIFVFLLLAGEIYTTFTFLGASGFAYGLGAPAYYIIAYGTLAYIIAYFMLPPIWRYARDHALHSQPDFFIRKYNSQALGALVSLVDLIALIPYLVLQLTGLGIIVVAAGYGAVSKDVAVWIGAAIVTVYVMVSGIHGSAWTSVVKDILILVVVLFLGIYLPVTLYGGIGPMFEKIDAAKPGFLVFAASGQSVAWFVSTVLLTAVGFFMWPHSFVACYTAKDERVFRRNAIVLPIYQLVLLFVFFVGFAAVLQVPGLKGADTNLALFKLVTQQFSPAVVGIIGAAGVFTALVPGSLITMTAAMLLAKNVAGLVRPNATDAQHVGLAKLLVPVVMLVAVYFTLTGSATIVAMLLLGYSFVTQLFPAVIASLTPRNPATAVGVFAGILVGVAVTAILTFTKTTVGSLFPELPEVVRDLNVGIIALVANVVVMVGVSAVTRSGVEAARA